MTFATKLSSFTFRGLLAATLVTLPSMTAAGVGDLLVAPTRIILDGGRGTEVILNNIGEETATYRISVELRRMKADGSFEEVTAPTPAEIAARDMIVYAPRRVTLAPRQPQIIRIAARAPSGLADGEYRVHLLFRAIPPAPAPAAPTDQKGIGFQLIPVYGVTIPVIVRLGNLAATAAIGQVGKTVHAGKPAVTVELQRSGTRSTFGEVRVLRAGSNTPIAVQKGIAVYTELEKRQVTIPLDDSQVALAHGPVTVQYVETADGAATKVAEASATLR